MEMSAHHEPAAMLSLPVDVDEWDWLECASAIHNCSWRKTPGKTICCTTTIIDGIILLARR